MRRNAARSLGYVKTVGVKGMSDRQEGDEEDGRGLQEAMMRSQAANIYRSTSS